MAQLEALTDRRCRLTASEVAKLYNSALERMTGRIQKIFRRFAEGYSLTPAETRELLSAAETREARQVLQDAFDHCTDAAERGKLRARLDAPAYGYRISRLEALRDQVYADAVAIGAEEVRYDEARLKDIYQQSYYRTAFSLSQEQGENVPFSILTDRQTAAALNAYWSPGAESVAQNYSQRVWENTEQLAQNVQEIVTRGIMTGERYEGIATELEASMGGVSWGKQVQPDGSTRAVLSGSGAKYRATRLIRTEGNYLSGQATIESLQTAGVERYLFHSLLEVRTCKVCGELDGKDFPVSEQQPGVNMNPMHPQCRCFIGPYRSKEELSRRVRTAQTGADEWGTVPRDMSYQEWYGKYVEGSPAMQGAEKAVQNKAADRRQWREYRTVLGEDAPKTLDDFQKVKYNDNDDKWGYTKAYKRAVQTGELTPLADFKLYKQTASDIQNTLVGVQTFDGVSIAGFSKHYIARTIGSVEQRRSGVPVESALRALTEPTQIRVNAKSRKYILDGVCAVSVNPETGRLIQVNPFSGKGGKTGDFDK